MSNKNKYNEEVMVKETFGRGCGNYTINYIKDILINDNIISFELSKSLDDIKSSLISTGCLCTDSIDDINLNDEEISSSFFNTIIENLLLDMFSIKTKDGIPVKNPVINTIQKLYNSNEKITFKINDEIYNINKNKLSSIIINNFV